MIRNILRNEIEKIVGQKVDFTVVSGGVHADYASNVALKLTEERAEFFKDSNVHYGEVFEWKPGGPIVTAKERAEVIKNKLLKSENFNKYVSKTEIADSGFLNFFIKDDVFIKNVGEIIKTKDKYGSNDFLKGKKIMVEYTDPNPFKEFHIGHLMSNAIGESIARLYETQGAIVKRACYQGDVGLHVAKAIWCMLRIPRPKDDYISYIGNCYVTGFFAYDGKSAITSIDPAFWYDKPLPEEYKNILTPKNVSSAHDEIEDINKKIFSQSDKEINKLYKWGREESLKHFEEIYKIFGTKFDYYFFEGKEGMEGKPIVEEFLKKGVFEKSDGAIVFRGEKYGLHTRVFISSQGLPTYEAKELGLNKAKFDKEPDLRQSIIVTANEQSDYFKVVLKAMEQIFPNVERRTKHIAHGLLRFASGKMSSSKGNVIAGELLIKQVKELVFKKIKEREFLESEKEKITGMVAIGAIKYSILKQAIGGDIIYDFDKSISFEGDSGPYIQYTYVRTQSILRKAKENKINELKNVDKVKNEKISDVEQLIQKFPETVEMAAEKYAPNYICSYLVELCRVFNSYYAEKKIVSNDDIGRYRIALARAIGIVLKNGLNLLGISAPERM